jgi:hypothetical protein
MNLNTKVKEGKGKLVSKGRLLFGGETNDKCYFNNNDWKLSDEITTKEGLEYFNNSIDETLDLIIKYTEYPGYDVSHKTNSLVYSVDNKEVYSIIYFMGNDHFQVHEKMDVDVYNKIRNGLYPRENK